MRMHSNGRANSLLRAGNSSECDSARDSGCTDDPHRVPSMTVQATRSNQHRVAMSTLHLAEGAAGAPEAMASQRGRRAPTAPVAGPKGSSSNSRTPIRDEPRAWRAARDQARADPRRASGAEQRSVAQRRSRGLVRRLRDPPPARVRQLLAPTRTAADDSVELHPNQQTGDGPRIFRLHDQSRAG